MTVGKMLRLLAGSVSARFAGAGIGLMTQLVLTRSFTQSDVGVIFMAMSMAGLFSLIVSLGYPPLAMTLLPRFQTLGRSPMLRAFHGAFLRDWSALTIAIFAATALTVMFLPLDPGLRLALIFGCISANASSLLRYYSAIANVERRFTLSYVPDSIFRPGLFFIYIVSAFFLGVSLSLPHVLWAFVVSNIAVAVGIMLVMRKQGLRLGDWFLVRPTLQAPLRRRATALGVIAAVTTMFADIVTIIGGLIMPHSDVALLGLAIRLSAIAGYVIQSSQQFVLSDLTQALTRHDNQTANALLIRMNLMTITITVIGLAVTIVAGRFFLGFFGPAYQQGQWLLVLLMCGQAVRALSGMNQNLLSIGSHQVRSAWASLTGLIVLVVSWLLLEPWFGLYSVGFAVIIAEISWAVTLARQVAKKMGRRGDIFWLLVHRNA